MNLSLMAIVLEKQFKKNTVLIFKRKCKVLITILSHVYFVRLPSNVSQFPVRSPGTKTFLVKQSHTSFSSFSPLVKAVPSASVVLTKLRLVFCTHWNVVLSISPNHRYTFIMMMLLRAVLIVRIQRQVVHLISKFNWRVADHKFLAILKSKMPVRRCRWWNVEKFDLEKKQNPCRIFSVRKIFVFMRLVTG